MEPFVSSLFTLDYKLTLLFLYVICINTLIDQLINPQVVSEIIAGEEGQSKYLRS